MSTKHTGDFWQRTATRRGNRVLELELQRDAAIAALREIAALAANEGTEVDSLLADIRAIATAAATSEVYSPGAGKFDNLGRVRGQEDLMKLSDTMVDVSPKSALKFNPRS